MPKEISFDFDSTLSRKTVQNFCKSLIKKGYKIYILTTRIKNLLTNNDDLYIIANKLKIPINNIIFTCTEPKFKYLLQLNFFCHFDDDEVEVEEINKYTKTKGILVRGNVSWKKEFNLLVKNLGG